MPFFLSHVAVKIRGLCLIYIVYGAISPLVSECGLQITSPSNQSIPNFYNVYGYTMLEVKMSVREEYSNVVYSKTH